MVLPLLLGLAGSALGGAGMLGGLGALGAGAIGAGLGSYAQTGDLEKGILTGLGSFAGGALLGPMMGGTGAAASGAGGTVKSLLPELQAASASPLKYQLGNLGQGAMEFAKSGTGIGAGIGGMAGSMAGNALFPDKPKEKKFESRDDMMPMPRNYATPPTGYRPGIDPEWNYGISTPQPASALRDYNRRFYGGGVVKALGPIKLAAGGIAALAGVDGEEYNSDAGVDAPSGGNEKDVVVEAIRAIKGQVEDPRIPLGRFLAMYGEDALRDLVEKVQSGKAEGEASKDGGRVRGPGDGMDDRVPAKIKDTGEDVLLADSEYVVPADVVSGLGNGSSDAGAKVLDDMLERVREERTGKKAQPKAIDAKEALPA